MAWRLRQISSAVWTGIASARSSDKGLCSLGMIPLSDYWLDGYLTSKHYLHIGQMSYRRQDCKNEMCGFFFMRTCVSKPIFKSPGMRKVWVYICMCTTTMCILACVLNVPSHRRSIMICWSNKSPSQAKLCVYDILACVLHVPSHSP